MPGAKMPRILIIDDDKALRKLLRRSLESVGFEVDELGDGTGAVRRMRELQADLVIVDIFMPRQEGIETLMELQHEFPTLKSIAISGRGMTDGFDYLSYARAFGADWTSTKPCGGWSSRSAPERHMRSSELSHRSVCLRQA